MGTPEVTPDWETLAFSASVETEQARRESLYLPAKECSYTAARRAVEALERRKARERAFEPPRPVGDFDSEKQRLQSLDVETYFHKLTGREAWGRAVRCPLHADGDSPSFYLYRETDSWHCFGCGKGGRIYELAALLWGYEVPLRGEQFKEVHGRLVEATTE